MCRPVIDNYADHVRISELTDFKYLHFKTTFEIKTIKLSEKNFTGNPWLIIIAMVDMT